MEFASISYVDADWVLGEGRAPGRPLQLCRLQRGDCQTARAPDQGYEAVGVDAAGSVIAWAPRGPDGLMLSGYRLASVHGDWIGPLRDDAGLVWRARFIDAHTVLVNNASVHSERGGYDLPPGASTSESVAHRGPWLLYRVSRPTQRPGFARLLRLGEGAVQRMYEASRACLPVAARTEWLGETDSEACSAFAACEAGHGREGPPPPACRDLPPEPAPTGPPPLDLQALRANNQALQQQSAALLEQAEAVRATVQALEAQLDAAREAAE